MKNEFVTQKITLFSFTDKEAKKIIGRNERTRRTLWIHVFFSSSCMKKHTIYIKAFRKKRKGKNYKKVLFQQRKSQQQPKLNFLSFFFILLNSPCICSVFSLHAFLISILCRSL